MMRRYFICYYIAFYLISIGEMCPKTEMELIVSTIIMVVSAFLIANIFGQMAVLTKEMNAKTIKFQEQLDTVNTAMKNLNLPVWLKRQVKEFYINTQARQDQQEELTNFLKNISPSLKLKSTIQIYKGVLESNPVFSTLLVSED
jgi:predicted PurR-regulated permease PerM